MYRRIPFSSCRAPLTLTVNVSSFIGRFGALLSKNTIGNLFAYVLRKQITHAEALKNAAAFSGSESSNFCSNDDSHRKVLCPAPCSPDRFCSRNNRSMSWPVPCEEQRCQHRHRFFNQPLVADPSHPVRHWRRAFALLLQNAFPAFSHMRETTQHRHHKMAMSAKMTSFRSISTCHLPLTHHHHRPQKHRASRPRQNHETS